MTCYQGDLIEELQLAKLQRVPALAGSRRRNEWAAAGYFAFAEHVLG